MHLWSRNCNGSPVATHSKRLKHYFGKNSLRCVAHSSLRASLEIEVGMTLVTIGLILVVTLVLTLVLALIEISRIF